MNPTSYLSEYKSLFRLGFPVLITQLGIILVSFFDTAMVGAYGVDELASAAFVNSVFMIPVVMQIGFAQGTTPLVGTLYGRGESEAIGGMLRSGLTVNFILSTIFTLIMGALFFFVGSMGQPEELIPIIRPYYLVILASLIPMAVFNVCQQTCNGLTDTATPMWVMIGSNVINIAGNYILIFGHWGAPELGLLGAGLSTLLSRVAAALAMLIILGRAPRFRSYWLAARRARDMAPQRRLMWKTSLPVMVQSGFEVALWSGGAVVCGWFGKIQLASYQVVNTIAQLGFMIFLSFGVATSVRVSNYTGQGDISGVRRITVAGLHINLILATLACLLFYFCGHDLAHIFTPDPEVIAAASLLIPPLILYQYGDAIQLTYANALRGTSWVNPLMIVSIVAYCVVGLPLLYFMGVTLGMHNVGIYYSFSVSLFLAAAMLYLFFRHRLKRMQQ
ncbi:MAG: MATE family efflux transporter [Bacteroides sp.]|nr:MATE family efflux transporter [Bacteroides sp.]